MKLTKYIMACILAFSLAGCIDDEPSNNPITYGDGYITVLLSTDKAAYQPGEPVQLSLNNLPEGQVTIRYKHLNKVLSETPSPESHGVGIRRQMTLKVIWSTYIQ